MITVIGGGLAGVEAAWQAAKRGTEVTLYEMRPEKMTPAHKTGLLAELVCSNSLRSDFPCTAPGLLKNELRMVDSLIINCAEKSRVEAGRALAVDREEFSKRIEEAILTHPSIKVVRKEIKDIPEGPVIIATGPLTSPDMTEKIKELCGENSLYFYDAVAPIVAAETIDFNKAFKASRYNEEDEGDYINCPMSEEEYRLFNDELLKAEKAPIHDFEEEKYFEGCLPVEEIARRGYESLSFGPLKPVGIVNIKEPEKKFFAIVQLRAENREGTMYNLVGFQTRLKWKEQERVFRLIPGLERAEFYRFGVIHRNTFINAPRHLDNTWTFKNNKNIFLAGQITGIEGYLEAASSGFMAGINAARLCRNLPLLVFPRDTAMGALSHYLTSSSDKTYQPMKINFGLFRPIEIKTKMKKSLKRQVMADRALKEMEQFKVNLEIKGEAI